MNCTQYKDNLLDALAADETILPTDLLAHQQSCADCRAFHESQANLFRSMEAGLFAVANQPVPPSFLAGVRVRLGEQPAPHRSWFAGWHLAAVAATTVAALLVVLLWHRPVARPGISLNRQVASQTVDNQLPPALAASNSAAISASPVHRGMNPVLSPAVVSEAEPEVLVLPEEREAFARFVARLPKEKNVALALAHPAPERVDAPVEIALLDLGNIEVKPLESESRE